MSRDIVIKVAMISGLPDSGIINISSERDVEGKISRSFWHVFLTEDWPQWRKCNWLFICGAPSYWKVASLGEAWVDEDGGTRGRRRVSDALPPPTDTAALSYRSGE
jgi:hypothetical protein